MIDSSILAKIEALMAAVADSGISELEIAEPPIRIRIVVTPDAKRKSGDVEATSNASGQTTDSGDVAATNNASGQTTDQSSSETILQAPFNGQFHRSPTPDSKPFVEIGARVAVGQALCVLEAMKNFTRLTAPVDGIVREILVESGADVVPDQALMRIEHSSSDKRDR